MTRMGDEAAQLEQRCDVAAGTRDGVKTAIGKKARETKAELTEFMRTYLEDAEALDGLEFLSMAEAGELAHWEILDTLNQTANNAETGGSSSSPSRFSTATSMPCASTPCASRRPKIPRSRRERRHAGPIDR